MRWRKVVTFSLGGLLLLLGLLAGVLWALTFHPAEIQAESVTCPDDAPMLGAGQTVKVVSWNVQFMAGKGYVFFFDVMAQDGPDERPSPEAITQTIEEVARVIEDEQPDIILLQEVDDGASRTDREDQLERLLALLPDDYQCHTSAFYWKAAFVPHPRIRGATGMKLSTISRFQIDEARRHQLELIPADPITQQFSPKRAILEARLPLTDGNELVVLNTHLDAFAQGHDTMTRQVEEVSDLLAQLTQEGYPWLIGGDFNLLPSPEAYALLQDDEKGYYNPQTEITPLYDIYQAVPSRDETSGADRALWFTHIPNDPRVPGLDRTIDYIFFSGNLAIGEHYIRQQDTMTISDHLPVVAEFSLP